MEARLSDVETERLWLRRWSAAQHSAALADINLDPRVMRFVGGAPLSAAESAEAAERFDAHWETYGFGLWAAMEKASGHTLGFIGLSHPLWNPELVEEVEVGWRLRRSAWGRGLATEGGAAALRAGFEDLGLEEIIAIVDPENGASVAVARKLGMTLRERRVHPQTGIPIDVMTRARSVSESSRAARRRLESDGSFACPPGAPVLPDRAPGGGGQARGSRRTGLRQAWARGRTIPGRRVR